MVERRASTLTYRYRNVDNKIYGKPFPGRGSVFIARTYEAQDRRPWKAVINGLCLRRDEGHNKKEEVNLAKTILRPIYYYDPLYKACK